MTCPTLISTGVAAAVQIDWPAASTVTRTLSDLTARAGDDVRARAAADDANQASASTVTSVGSRETSVGAGVAVVAEGVEALRRTRTESTLTASAGSAAWIEMFETGPADAHRRELDSTSPRRPRWP
jgi:hypothetical protein